MNEPIPVSQARRFAVAPMMNVTDRHCRYFFRLLTRRALLFTEMITSSALVRGQATHLLEFDPIEHPVAAQLGGADPAELADAASLCARTGYDEINLNVGCPSDRVHSGRFGACLMADPETVAASVTAMKAATALPVTVKCRVGIDDQDTERDLDRFADRLVAAGVDAIYVHARKAWLEGLSPAENRDVPPLDHERVYRLRDRLAPLPVIVNGGIETLADAAIHLGHVDGVMVGRAAAHRSAMLARVDREIFGARTPPPTLPEVGSGVVEYAERLASAGIPLRRITRHLLGLAHGRPGAREVRRLLSVEAARDGAGIGVIERAFALLGTADPQREAA
jgi:tRNA-dihydrouridine synthase A